MLEKVFIAIALFFTLSAAIGVWRLPDFYTRMHAASKVSSFGVGFLLVAVSIHFWGDWAALTKSILIFVFIVITNPISAHLLMRAAYRLKTPQAATSSCNEYAIAAKGVIQEKK
jgi:multicomponent Na+:H+ antiporter subunit G